MTHYIPAFTVSGSDGTQRAACGQMVYPAEHSPSPECAGCLSWIDALAAPPITPVLKFPSSKLCPPEDPTERALAAMFDGLAVFEAALANTASADRAIQLQQRLDVYRVCLGQIEDAMERLVNHLAAQGVLYAEHQ